MSTKYENMIFKEKLGAGIYGTVYLAEDQNGEQYIVLYMNNVH